MNPLGIYIHIPYCLHKCGYCDFNSHPENQEESEVYVPALLLEIEHYAQKLAPQTVPTVFFGGGTPTLLPPASLDKILGKVKQHFNLSADCEITIEANPATIKQETLEQIRSSGFNRISIGVQSFDLDELKLLERVHNEEEIHTTVDRARLAGFDNLSLDLMSGLPGQSPAIWQSHLQQALDKKPEHISAYGLTIEPTTSFFKLQERGLLTLPPEETHLEMFQTTIETLQSAGYEQYEISNFSRHGFECRHNLNYWDNGEYLGLGAGASSYLKGERFKNTNLPSRYIREVQAKGSAVESTEKLDLLHAMGETIMLGLRRLKGISIEDFENRFQISFKNVYGKVVDPLLNEGLITFNQNRMALSRKGLFIADSVILKFLA
ncbi:MAG: radical SAM family heme chaperone HemW [Nitrospina sp.]|jgi:oxygen-independent coproporphyrinogen III oxidase|nr:radical SAM family heme chaperone HemW [Nitrospina sp.]MBT3509771.1 radical SAM family heme chaperone HemW [Nitrospina sp.]MBT3874870.1 radical SAM family heme chaperone HemW [Nitrospina sp.]MBT4049769.1 radical SAM family heme chaperone HemW [Nitrospina sp.]MBT4558749.1 radical SAM family heme chaperone HemW [Nitrospina sp.]